MLYVNMFAALKSFYNQNTFTITVTILIFTIQYSDLTQLWLIQQYQLSQTTHIKMLIIILFLTLNTYTNNDYL